MPITGSRGSVDGKSTVRNWKIARSNELKRLAASNTGGVPMRKPGVFKWTGSYGAYGLAPQVLPGQTFAFVGQTPLLGSAPTAAPTYSGAATVDNVVITLDWENAEIISHVVNFMGNGRLVESTGSIVDESDVVCPPTCGARFRMGASADAMSDMSDVTKLTLTLSASNKPYTNSSTACAVTVAGGRPDWSLSYDRQETQFPFAEGSTVVAQIVPAGGADDEGIILSFGIIGKQDFEVDIENDEIVGYSETVDFTAVDSEGNAGSIIIPGHPNYWTGA